MFTMMNAARLGVGMQGLGLAEVAYQNAVAYARERLQGRSLTGAKAPDKPADPIIVHPDVRRMLLTSGPMTEGCRALACWVALELDVAHHHPDAAVRQRGRRLRRAADADRQGASSPTSASRCANLGMQVYGGHGYIRENGMEQFVRDARITQIYEGTNGIQALDLVGRKLARAHGPLAAQLLPSRRSLHRGEEVQEAMEEFVEPLAKAFGRLQQATIAVATKSLSNPDEAGAAASDYLRLFGLTALAYLWARMAEIASPRRAAKRVRSTRPSW